jgi:SAM-dependent methyltransferase
MTRCRDRLDRRFYPKFGEIWDDALFRQEILSHITTESVLLDLGAGAGIVEQMNFRGAVAKVCGIDLDSRVLDNPFLDIAKVTDGNDVPFPDESFDIVISDNVLEHLENPESVFREVERVLRPNGVFLFKTPNRSHYMPLIARVTPHGFHRFVNRLRGRNIVDTFPTLYRANSRREVSLLAATCGLKIEKIDLIEGRPEYTRMFCLLYVLGIAYERVVNRFGALSRFRVLIVGVLSKPGQTQ